jgi:fructokinase
MKKVYCIGEALIDFVAENQGSDLRKAVTFTKKAGGAPANVACAINKLNGNAAFVGAVGDDAFGAYLKQTLVDHKVDIGELQETDVFTSLAFVSIAQDGERDFVFSRGADKCLEYNPKLKHQFNNQILHFGAATGFLGGGLEEAYNHYLFDALTQEAFICFDPNFREDLWQEKRSKFIKKCIPFVEKSHLCKFSLEEALIISGATTVEEACEKLHQIGVPIICITLGSEGTLVSCKGTSTLVESIAVSPVDTTGAGDSFIGCLLRQISELEDPISISEDFDKLKEMIGIANKAGAITTTKFGAIAALPTSDEVF